MIFHTIRSAGAAPLAASDRLSGVAQKTFPFEEMISASYSLDQVNDAMQAMASYQVVKAAIKFQ